MDSERRLKLAKLLQILIQMVGGEGVMIVSDVGARYIRDTEAEGSSVINNRP